MCQLHMSGCCRPEVLVSQDLEVRLDRNLGRNGGGEDAKTQGMGIGRTHQLCLGSRPVWLKRKAEKK